VPVTSFPRSCQPIRDRTIIRRRFHRQPPAGGFSFLELQVAFVLLGIALMGVVPLVVMQSRQLKAIEGRLGHGQTYYLVPAESEWARKLGARATIQPTQPQQTGPSTGGEPAQDVTVLSLSKSLLEQTVSVRLRVQEIPSEP
jgi:hypothetical protein